MSTLSDSPHSQPSHDPADPALDEPLPIPLPIPLPPPYEPREGVPAVIVDQVALEEYAARLRGGTGPLALDAERASGYRYDQRAYLIQLRRTGSGSALIDPIACPDLSVIQDATVGVEWILHAATQDLPCLAEVGLTPTALFDTELAGRLLGRERVSLAPLVLGELGEVLEKGHGANDWSVRPLSAAQLRYAALDVELLVELRDAMAAELVEAGKWEYARQEFESLLGFTPRDHGEDAWRRTSGIHRLRRPRDLAMVRSLWHARDQIARKRDIAVGRILPDAALVAAAQGNPGTIESLSAIKEFTGRGAQRYLKRWWDALESARALPNEDLPASTLPPTGPPQPRTWSDRDPAAFARLEAARKAVGAIATRLSIPVENVLSPDLLRRLCWEPPEPAGAAEITAFLSELGARPWQAGLTVDALVIAMGATPPPEATDQ